MGSAKVKKEIKRKDSHNARPARKKSHKRSISDLISGSNMKIGILVILALGFLLCVVKMPVFKPNDQEKNSTFEFNPAKVIQISWKPRVFLYKGFLSDQECDHLIMMAKKKLAKSMVANDKSGEGYLSEVRTSSGMFLKKRQDEIVDRIEKRIANWVLLPEENAETIQILRYEHGQKYEPHYDFFVDKKNQKQGGHRLATVLMYLSDVKLGGETVFPNAQFGHLQFKDDTWSDCAWEGLAVKSVKGDAVLFFNLNPDGTTDPKSLHGSCPVIEGEKWSAPNWIHVGSYEDQSYTAPDNCYDEHEKCQMWADSSECDTNTNYMFRYCRHSCKVCGAMTDE
ncbi:Prolyl 4-hydroxylase subunit alpha-2 [Rhynchospora pubera]|uniref:procollagen-proline 4-dioxygenase n=1 Tax=Rhynchospora pubera TaxID=906938 RepID=A0AAV8GZP8_9POAL|nr:Prolyl 4-hydroxylase subunit alpha-2 [Rhynchospora pubera]